jgi:hypothetical protein
MSNAFAIAAVTAALKRLLREQLVQVHSDTGALPANFVVSAEAPDRNRVRRPQSRRPNFGAAGAPRSNRAKRRAGSRG